MRIIKNLSFFVFIFFALFGPKIYTYIDLMFFVPLLILLISGFFGRIVVANIYTFRFLAFQLFCFLWLIFTIILNQDYHIESILRMARSIASSIIIYFFIINVIKNKLIEPFDLICFLIYALAINSVIIILQIYSLNFQYITAEIWGFDKSLNNSKAFGLTAGYDTAGYLAVFGSFLSLILLMRLKKFIFLVLFLLMSTSVFYTSRTAMVLYILAIAMALIFNAYYISKVYKFSIIGIVALFLYNYGINFIALLSSTIVELQFINLNFDSVSDLDLTHKYATASIFDIFSEMFIIPNDIFTLIWGTGLIVPWSDVGYVKLIYLSGAPFLILVIGFYLYLYFGTLKIFKCSFYFYSCKNESYVLIQFFSFYLVLFFISNFKNLYFFTRGYHELFIFLSSILIGHIYLNFPSKKT